MLYQCYNCGNVFDEKDVIMRANGSVAWEGHVAFCKECFKKEHPKSKFGTGD